MISQTLTMLISKFAQKKAHGVGRFNDVRVCGVFFNVSGFSQGCCLKLLTKTECIHTQNTHSDICRRRMELGQVAEMPRHASEAEMTKVSKVIQTNRLMYFGYLLLACVGLP